MDTLKGNQILKVGKSRSFKTNPAGDKRYIAMEQPGKRPGLRFYLATFTVPSGRSGGGVIEMIEDAIARLLYRAGRQLPEHGKPFRVQTVTNTVSIRNVLPPDLRYLLSRSYGHEGYRKSGRDFKKQIIPRRIAGAHAPASTDTLYLSDQSYPRWEIENNNVEPELFPILPWQGGRPHLASGEDGNDLQTQYGSRPRRVGRIIVLPDDDNATLYGEIPIFYDGDDPDLFLGKIVKRAGRLAGQVSKTISKTVDTVKRAAGPLGGIADFAWKMSPIGSAVTATQRGLDAASAVVRGERIDRIIRKNVQARIGDFKERLKFAEMVAPFIPGLGTGVAAALGAANALASGKPITEALISAARSAIPGGRIAQAGFDTAMNLAKGKSLSESALATVRSQLPSGQQAAFDAGLALAQGKNLQQAAYKAAGRIIPPSPFAANALAFTRAATSGKNIQNAALSAVGRRVLQGKKVYRKPSNKQRELSFELIPEFGGDNRITHTGAWI